MSAKLSNMLSEIDTSVSGNFSRDSLNDGNITGQSTPRIFPIYICINEYLKRMEDELNMKPGDKIQVITDDEEYNDGWYFGKNLRTKEEGLYPVVFTQVISTERKPTLMRAKSLKRMNSPSTPNEGSDISASFNGSLNNHSTNISTSSHNNGEDGLTSLVSRMTTSGEFSTPKSLRMADSSPTKKTGTIRDEIFKNDPQNDKLDRKVSVKSTMSDIDKAIDDFQFEPAGESTNGPSNPTSLVNLNDDSVSSSFVNSTLFSSTADLNLANRPPTSATPPIGEQSKNTNANHDRISVANAADWTPEEVSQYFMQCGFDQQSSSMFKQHKISGKILLELELVHLKELDVNSFGTRFEMFKEIESLKQQVKALQENVNQDFGVAKTPSFGVDSGNPMSRELMPPAFVDYRAQSSDTIPSSNASTPTISVTKSSKKEKSRPTSLVLNNQTPRNVSSSTMPLDIVDEIADPSMFVSPRRAPKPPSYPSPVQPPKSPMIKSAGSNKSNSTPLLNSNKSYSPPSLYQSSANKSGPPNNDKESVGPEALTIRTPSVKQSLRIPESDPAGLHTQNDDASTNGRPSSSVYDNASVEEALEEMKLQDATPDDDEDPRKVKRNSSMRSYFSKNQDKRASSTSGSLKRSSSFTLKKKNGLLTSPFKQQFTDSANRNAAEDRNISKTKEDPRSPPKKNKFRSVSAKESPANQPVDAARKILEGDKSKRSVSEAMKNKSLRTMATRAPPKKLQTTAFTEGLRTISVKDAMKTAGFSGWMSKKGSGTMSTWKTRFFTLEGTRLSYFASTTDTRERGLIDVTGYRVVPAKEDDKFVSLYAASTGKGRYCFKLLPPQPGSKKGLTFTQPRVHYFAVDTKEEMRGWMAHLIKTTIDIDTSVPVISSYSTPTVSLSKAKEMLAEARAETKLREKERLINDDEEDEGKKLWDQQHQNSKLRSQQRKQEKFAKGSTPNSSTETVTNTVTNTSAGSNGFASPYLLASGMSPDISRVPGSRTPHTKDKKLEGDYFGSSLADEQN
ncbi:Boi2p KNAG_0C03420 [Huiozyma naganishii CBS 8797]|uniref:Protein BOI2 n=1 Tax=Huiozyma naganishii (strain ATCC MYA-139 / BCRC 22969 / CBS 8797 / KCTC 17520 / NBRC 10181 / NCYC 3082 / Yp74L-3) TaxID=1071383 RepID=J7S4S7_HUIN7|nr:hypothetical protein KNAG_0C03420 [Kazachstania naganishii CBS 8797]CCK69449.1 hypothetical protein KNAG_0C03420 [Kazachstania naganishii CBS 8797]